MPILNVGRLALGFLLNAFLVQIGTNAQEISSGNVQILSVGAEGGAPIRLDDKLISGNISIGGLGTSLGINPDSKSSLFRMLGNESVRSELKLTEQQRTSAQRILDESNQRMSDLVKKSIREGRGINGTQIAEFTSASRKEAEAAIEEILLPAQLKRIRQLAYQVEVSRSGLGEALTTGRLGKEVGVTDNQKQHLSEKAAAIEAELRQAIVKLRSAAQAKLLEELSTQQRQEAHEMLGDYFYFEEPSIEQSIRQNLKLKREELKK